MTICLCVNIIVFLKSQVTGVNDLPVARTFPELSKVPALKVGQPNTGVPVEMYAEAFFQDPENSVLGIIILQAFSAPDGDTWQYSIDDGKTFVDVSLFPFITV